MSKRPAAKAARPTAKEAPAGRKPASRPAATNQAPAKQASPKQAPANQTSPKQAPATPPAPEPTPDIPPTLRAAAAIQALEALRMVVATAFSAVATVDGKSYQTGSGVALTLIALGTALVLGLVARGLVRARPWSRTPAAMIQVFAIIAGVLLMDGHRPEWGVPTLLLAAGGLVTLFVPASFKALNRER